MYLLDTNVISELRKPRPHGGVLAWLNTVDNHLLYLSAVSFGEIQAGIEITRTQDPAKAVEIERWVDEALSDWNILAVDSAAIRLCATLMHRQPATPVSDAMIAATAKVHKLTVATRNVKDFRLFQVSVLNPFETPRAMT